MKCTTSDSLSLSSHLFPLISRLRRVPVPLACRCKTRPFRCRGAWPSLTWPPSSFSRPVNLSRWIPRHPPLLLLLLEALMILALPRVLLSCYNCTLMDSLRLFLLRLWDLWHQEIECHSSLVGNRCREEKRKLNVYFIVCLILSLIWFYIISLRHKESLFCYTKCSLGDETSQVY